MKFIADVQTILLPEVRIDQNKRLEKAVVYPLPKLKSPNRFRFLPSKLYKLFSDSKGASLVFHPQEFNFESHSDVVNIKFSSVDSDGITIANYNLVVHVVY